MSRNRTSKSGCARRPNPTVIGQVHALLIVHHEHHHPLLAATCANDPVHEALDSWRGNHRCYPQFWFHKSSLDPPPGSPILSSFLSTKTSNQKEKKEKGRRRPRLVLRAESTTRLAMVALGWMTVVACGFFLLEKGKKENWIFK